MSENEKQGSETIPLKIVINDVPLHPDDIARATAAAELAGMDTRSFCALAIHLATVETWKTR